MDTHPIDRILSETLEDHRLSRAERRGLSEVLGELDANQLAQIRSRAFHLARQAVGGADPLMTIGWLEDVVKALHALEREDAPIGPASLSEALFAPGDGPRLRIQSIIERARARVDCCVFTITDDRIARSLESAFRRGVKVRILTDDDKSRDRGSDIRRLGRAGIPIRFDQTDAHMHHKFALVDGEVLLTGSYNWTRSAASSNQENVLFTDDARAVRAFQGEFDRLWALLA